MIARVLVAVVALTSLVVGMGCQRSDADKASPQAASTPNAPPKPDPDRQMQLFDQAIEQKPADANAYFNRAGLWMDKGNFDKALADCDQAIRLTPNNPGFLTSRGAIWHTKGIKEKDRAKCEEKALADYAEALRLNPKFALALNNRAWILATSKIDSNRDGKKAIDDATKACELTNWKNAGFVDTLSAAYAEVGDFEQATKWQKKALEDSTYARQEEQNAKEKLTLYSQKKPFRE
jgi:tetratricopeptide (TPR) repeat protein